MDEKVKKLSITTRIDEDILSIMRSHYKNYQTKINSVLRAHVNKSDSEYNITSKVNKNIPLYEYNRRDIQRVVCSACWTTIEEMGISRIIVVTGARHWDEIMRSQALNMGISIKTHKWEQGFIDQFRNLLTREEAYEVAIRNKQPLRDHPSHISGTLYSEDLY